MIEYTDEQHDSLIRGHRKQLADAQATVEALQRERGRLRKALRPFAEVGEVLDTREFINLYERRGTSGKRHIISMQHLKHAAAIMVQHKQIYKRGAMGATVNTTLCGRMQLGEDGMNVGKVTCKLCLKKMQQRRRR